MPTTIIKKEATPCGVTSELFEGMCSHLRKKLFEHDGVYYDIWLELQRDPELTAVVRNRQLHIYRNGKKILVLAGKAQPKIVREDRVVAAIRDYELKS